MNVRPNARVVGGLLDQQVVEVMYVTPRFTLVRDTAEDRLTAYPNDRLEAA